MGPPTYRNSHWFGVDALYLGSWTLRGYLVGPAMAGLEGRPQGLGGVPKRRGPVLGAPIRLNNQDHTIFRLILGPLIFGNSHLSPN